MGGSDEAKAAYAAAPMETRGLPAGIEGVAGELTDYNINPEQMAKTYKETTYMQA